jgi:hypothetical protein
MLPLTEIMRICSATSRRHGDDVGGGGPELKIHSIPCIWLGSFQEKDEDLLDAKSPGREISCPWEVCSGTDAPSITITQAKRT